MAGIASLGGRAVFLGKVSDDRLGRRFGESLKALGVDYTTARAMDGSSTASCMIAVTPDGQRSMNTYLGACRELTPDDVDEERSRGGQDPLYRRLSVGRRMPPRKPRARRSGGEGRRGAGRACPCPTVSASAVSATNSCI